MGGGAADLSLLSHGLAALGYLAFAAHLLRQQSLAGESRAGSRALSAAVLLSAAWAAVAAVEPLLRWTAPAYALAALDIARYGAWFAFVLLALRPALQRPGSVELKVLMPAAGLLVVAAAGALGLRVATGGYEPDAFVPALALSLGLAVFGLVLVEQLLRNLPEDSRWNAKPACLGLGIVFAFDLYLFAEGVLFGRLDRDALAIRGAAHLLAVPLLALASRRRADWVGRIQVSRTAAFYSTTLLLAGGYLLFMAAVGYWVRLFGGEWGRALQIGLLVVAGAALTLLMLSGAWRARLRVFVGKHFFSYRYDYREEWLRFTAMLSSRGSPQEVGALVIRGLADMVESPGGTLWLKTGPDPDYRQAARWNAPEVADTEPAGSDFARFLATRGWVIDLDEYRSAPRRYGQLALPPWMMAAGDAVWIVVPLLAGDELLGFATLARPRTPVELDWEVRDLLKTASRQAAGFLAQMHATEALLEARKFEAFNRMSAFVVHDLKNIVTQLSLMLKNAQRHHDNPEFRQDMLLTVESSLEKMRRLMLQLREGGTPAGTAAGVELAPILRRLAAMAHDRGRVLEVAVADGLATRGQDERLERVLGHLVHNALDATPPEGRVWVDAARASGQVRVEIGDTGVGMSEEFVRTRLARPFSSTKQGGMGIGSFESFQYVRELGGTVDVDSTPGRGTVITLRLPLFEAGAGSDLHRAAQP